jgi:hypothetical protein
MSFPALRGASDVIPRKLDAKGKRRFVWLFFGHADATRAGASEPRAQYGAIACNRLPRNLAAAGQPSANFKEQARERRTKTILSRINGITNRIVPIVGFPNSSLTPEELAGFG